MANLKTSAEASGSPAQTGDEIRIARAGASYKLTIAQMFASPAFTGVPTAPTAAPANNSTQVATTAYADAIAALKANLASPTFTGTVTGPTITATTKFLAPDGTGAAPSHSFTNFTNIGMSASAGGALDFSTSGFAIWRITAGGPWVAVTDNTNSIGLVGANRPSSLYLASRLVAGQITETYSASITPDASSGNDRIITVTNGTAFTINAPTNPATGQFITVLIRNASGGAVGVITWNAVFKMTTFTNPANGFSRSIEFAYNGTNWVERSRGAADVPN